MSCVLIVCVNLMFTSKVLVTSTNLCELDLSDAAPKLCSPTIMQPQNYTAPKLCSPTIMQPQNYAAPQLCSPKIMQPHNYAAPKLCNPTIMQPQNYAAPQLCSPTIPALNTFVIINLQTQLKLLLDQHMHYILISKSITPTYVSVYNRPSSGGQSFLHRLYNFYLTSYLLSSSES
jgi:hypothetical protein